VEGADFLQKNVALSDEVRRTLADLDEIGKELGIPENSVGPILAKARRSLKRIAEQRNAS